MPSHLLALHWLPVQARIDCCQVSVTASSLIRSSPAYYSDLFIVYTPSRHLGSFADTRYFTSPILKPKPLANVLSLTVFQSNGILSLLVSVTFSHPMPSKLVLMIHFYKGTQTSGFQLSSSFCPHPPSHTPLIPITFLMHESVCVCACVRACV